MPIFELFSKRKAKAEKSGIVYVYTYDVFLPPFRVQVVHILNDTIGKYVLSDYPDRLPASNSIWDNIFKILTREYGLFRLAPDGRTIKDQILSFLLTCTTIQALDVIELSMRLTQSIRERWHYQEAQDSEAIQKADDAIKELNARFEEHGIGYEYIDGTIIRKDSQFIHSEIIKPALALLSDPDFSGAQDEFLNAHKFYRQGDKKQAVAEALKSFESTTKVICAKKGWTHPKNATAIPLINTLFENGLIPPEFESHFAGLRSSMESGLPTLSNKTSRHGQGLKPTDIENYLVEYALHLCAANIVFLIKLYKS